MRLVFAGTPEFARAALASLHAAGHQIALVLTQPDRPAGRGLKLQASPVKLAAQALCLPVRQPRSLRLDGKYPDDVAAAREVLQATAPDVMVVAAYGLILPAWTLALPRLGCLNIHASLLPRWRGAAPIHRAIEAGDGETGITIMQMDTGLDTGAMLLTAREPIHPDDTTAQLHDRLAALGARCIVDALAMADSGALRPQSQPDEGVTYAHKIDKSEAALDWRQPAALLARRVRAFDPFPGASFVHAGQVIKAWAGAAVEGRGPPGEVLASGPEALVVACGDGALALTQLQRPGGRRQGMREFLAAHPLPVGAYL
jgi:methionyl-tRNA formyltransferase